MKQYKEKYDKILQNENQCIDLVDDVLSDFVYIITA
jgi:hypothetical protein